MKEPAMNRPFRVKKLVLYFWKPLVQVLVLWFCGNRWSRRVYIYIYNLPLPPGSEKERRGAQHWLEVSTEYSKTWKATEQLQNVNTSWIHYYLCTKRGKLILLKIEYWIWWKYWTLNLLKILNIEFIENIEYWIYWNFEFYF